MIAFIDMDGVLVDFVRGVEQRMGAGTGKRDSFAIHEWYGLSPESFWQNFEDLPFWRDLPKTPEADDIMKTVEGLLRRGFLKNFYFATSPTLSPMCAAGKIMWLRQHYSVYGRSFFITPHKQMCSMEGRILIDDYENNVNRWKFYGGEALLFKRPWNDGTTTAETLEEDLIKIISEYVV